MGSATTFIKSFPVQRYWKQMLAILMLLLAVIFFRSERNELLAIGPHILRADPKWLAIAFVITLIFFLFEGGIYKQSFASVGLRLPLVDAVNLFLKRNFISVFLPAGGVSSLAYSPSQIRKAGFTKTQVHQASGLFSFIGLLTVVLVGIPIIITAAFYSNTFSYAWLGLLLLLSSLMLLFLLVKTIRNRGSLFSWVNNKWPAISAVTYQLFDTEINRWAFWKAVVFSVGVELCGILHIYIVMKALGLSNTTLLEASVAYIMSVLMMIVSPFLRGLGAVELSMVLVLEKFGCTPAQALSITILYRVFEFWLPLLFGLLAFAWKGKNLFLRIAPVMLIVSLGLVNIISAITPPIHSRLRLLHEYLPLTTIHASNLLVLLVGVSLLLTAAFLLKGLRSAWIMALGFTLFSLVGHLTKALDYEETILAAFTALSLLLTTSQYRVRSSTQWMRRGLTIALINFFTISILTFVSFYFIDKRHFGIDFTWQQSIVHTIKCFLLVEDQTLHPVTRFGHEFIWLIRALGFLTWSFFIISLFYTSISKKELSKAQNKQKATFLLNQFGHSPIDYFKLYKDKLYFFSDLHDAFLAYRIARGFAIVLEEPVCSDENKVDVLHEFDLHCRKMGLKTAFYRVDEDSIRWFKQLNKQMLMIGQEAILDINNFTLEGSDKKSLRNGLNGLQKKGYSTHIYQAPHSSAFIKKLREVSDEWLSKFQKQELVFSQGMFDEKELLQQDILALENNEHQLIAFLNVIPDYVEGECTYDLIRKTGDAPGAAMDALIIKLIEYAKARDMSYLNLGLVPLAGIAQPQNTAERIIKLAADKLKRYQHYKGLREFKEKYANLWENKYLVYDNDFDLLQLPIAINAVMKP
ncbi:phosphatidylglycerol lysyltransferase domain-containing protein [Flavisolibacter tropicus]|uniref:Phosphatidylglycerol lysyltransferase n=1 Tax=Flavisolibacter tropicus TaxID=1492898 RepID=A0A172TQ88_9BACT|nr:phosphatidylglycerol lysyltransferase domain-containing protein [Flavisolibacter tropicus]ANE49198.1 ABC transporter permease [Flavisolibacter tropicus]